MIELAIIWNTSSFWRLLKGQKPTLALQSLKVWKVYFNKLLHVHYAYDMDTQLDATFEHIFQIEDIINGIDKLQNKESDLHGLQAQMLKATTKTLAPTICTLFNQTLSFGFPRSWQCSTLHPIHKKDDMLCPANY